MFFVFPKRVELHTTLTPKQCRSKLRREMVEHKRKPSLVSASRFYKAHKLDSCYYGAYKNDGSFEVFYHRVKKHDGSSAGFFGKITKDENGSMISGRLRRTASVYVTLIVWTVALLLLVLCLVALDEFAGAACMAAVFVIGFALICQDSSAKYVMSYLDTFPDETNADEDEKDEIN
ncbi:MAG: hypothetical protein LUI06_08320 [Ruminococcus sp.]|nr:hypothetical protein [Ruminococcus sp.]